MINDEPESTNGLQSGNTAGVHFFDVAACEQTLDFVDQGRPFRGEIKGYDRLESICKLDGDCIARSGGNERKNVDTDRLSF